MNPAKILIGICLLGIGQFAFGQHIYKIKTDSLLVTNDSCNAELNLENRTRNVNGFLYNKGNGRTEFRKALVQLPDGRYLIGADTLNVKSGIDSGYIWNQYAQKQTARAWIDTLKARLITIPDSVNKTVSRFSESGIYITGSVKDSDTSSATVSKTGQLWNVMNPPLVSLSAPRSRNSYDIWGSGILSADRQWNVDTLTNAFWSPYGLINPIICTSPTVNVNQTVLLKGYQNAPTYTLHNDDWRGETFRVQTAYGKSSGSTGSWKLQYSYLPHQNIFSYIDFNNGSTVNFDFEAALYSARVQVNRADTFKAIRYYTIVPANAGGTKTPGSGARNQIGFQVPDLASSNIADNNFAFQSLGINDRNYFAGQTAIGDSSALNAGANKFYVNGSSKFAGNIYQNSGYRTLLNGAVDDSSTALQVNGNVLAQALVNKTGSVVNAYQPCQWWRPGGRFMGWIIDYNGTVAGGHAEMDLWTTGSTMVLERYYNDAGDWHINASQHGNLVFNVWPSYYIKLNAPRVQLTGVLNLPASTAPTSSTDSSGSDGDLKRDANGNVYLKANGQWSTLLNTQAQIESPVVVLKTLSVSNATSFDVDLTNYYTAYDRIDLEFSNVRPATDNISLQLYVSSDGVNFDNGTNNYKYSSNFSISNGSYGPHVSQGDTRINLGDMVGNAATGYFSGTLTLTDPDNSSVNPFIRIQIGYTSYQGDIITNIGWGKRLAAQVTKKIRIQPTSGNISGTVKIIGYK